jgi:hypothetical protein
MVFQSVFALTLPPVPTQEVGGYIRQPLQRQHQRLVAEVGLEPTSP